MTAGALCCLLLLLAGLHAQTIPIVESALPTATEPIRGGAVLPPSLWSLPGHHAVAWASSEALGIVVRIVPPAVGEMARFQGCNATTGEAVYEAMVPHQAVAFVKLVELVDGPARHAAVVAYTDGAVSSWDALTGAELFPLTRLPISFTVGFPEQPTPARPFVPRSHLVRTRDGALASVILARASTPGVVVGLRVHNGSVTLGPQFRCQSDPAEGNDLIDVHTLRGQAGQPDHFVVHCLLYVQLVDAGSGRVEGGVNRAVDAITPGMQGGTKLLFALFDPALDTYRAGYLDFDDGQLEFLGGFAAPIPAASVEVPLMVQWATVVGTPAAPVLIFQTATFTATVDVVDNFGWHVKWSFSHVDQYVATATALGPGIAEDEMSSAGPATPLPYLDAYAMQLRLGGIFLVIDAQAGQIAAIVAPKRLPTLRNLRCGGTKDILGEGGAVARFRAVSSAGAGARFSTVAFHCRSMVVVVEVQPFLPSSDTHQWRPVKTTFAVFFNASTGAGITAPAFTTQNSVLLVALPRRGLVALLVQASTFIVPPTTASIPDRSGFDVLPPPLVFMQGGASFISNALGGEARDETGHFLWRNRGLLWTWLGGIPDGISAALWGAATTRDVGLEDTTSGRFLVAVEASAESTSRVRFVDAHTGAVARDMEVPLLVPVPQQNLIVHRLELGGLLLAYPGFSDVITVISGSDLRVHHRGTEMDLRGLKPMVPHNRAWFRAPAGLTAAAYLPLFLLVEPKALAGINATFGAAELATWARPADVFDSDLPEPVDIERGFFAAASGNVFVVLSARIVELRVLFGQGAIYPGDLLWRYHTARITFDWGGTQLTVGQASGSTAVVWGNLLIVRVRVQNVRGLAPYSVVALELDSPLPNPTDIASWAPLVRYAVGNLTAPEEHSDTWPTDLVLTRWGRFVVATNRTVEAYNATTGASLWIFPNSQLRDDTTWLVRSLAAHNPGARSRGVVAVTLRDASLGVDTVFLLDEVRGTVVVNVGGALDNDSVRGAALSGVVLSGPGSLAAKSTTVAATTVSSWPGLPTEQGIEPESLPPGAFVVPPPGYVAPTKPPLPVPPFPGRRPSSQQVRPPPILARTAEEPLGHVLCLVDAHRVAYISDASVVAMDMRTGRVLWTVDHCGFANMASCASQYETPRTPEPVVVMCDLTDGFQVRALDPDTGAVRWSNDTQSSFTPIAYDGVVAVVHYKQVTLFNRSTGVVVGSVPATTYCVATPMVPNALATVQRAAPLPVPTAPERRLVLQGGSQLTIVDIGPTPSVVAVLSLCWTYVVAPPFSPAVIHHGAPAAAVGGAGWLVCVERLPGLGPPVLSVQVTSLATGTTVASTRMYPPHYHEAASYDFAVVATAQVLCADADCTKRRYGLRIGLVANFNQTTAFLDFAAPDAALQEVHMASVDFAERILAGQKHEARGSTFLTGSTVYAYSVAAPAVVPLGGPAAVLCAYIAYITKTARKGNRAMVAALDTAGGMAWGYVAESFDVVFPGMEQPVVMSIAALDATPGGPALLQIGSFSAIFKSLAEGDITAVSNDLHDSTATMPYLRRGYVVWPEGDGALRFVAPSATHRMQTVLVADLAAGALRFPRTPLVRFDAAPLVSVPGSGDVVVLVGKSHLARYAVLRDWSDRWVFSYARLVWSLPLDYDASTLPERFTGVVFSEWVVVPGPKTVRFVSLLSGQPAEWSLGLYSPCTPIRHHFVIAPNSVWSPSSSGVGSLAGSAPNPPGALFVVLSRSCVTVVNFKGDAIGCSDLGVATDGVLATTAAYVRNSTHAALIVSGPLVLRRIEVPLAFIEGARFSDVAPTWHLLPGLPMQAETSTQRLVVLPDNSTVLVTSLDVAVAAFDANSGRVLWRAFIADTMHCADAESSVAFVVGGDVALVTQTSVYVIDALGDVPAESRVRRVLHQPRLIGDLPTEAALTADGILVIAQQPRRTTVVGLNVTSRAVVFNVSSPLIPAVTSVAAAPEGSPFAGAVLLSGTAGTVVFDARRAAADAAAGRRYTPGPLYPAVVSPSDPTAAPLFSGFTCNATACAAVVSATPGARGLDYTAVYLLREVDRPPPHAAVAPHIPTRAPSGVPPPADPLPAQEALTNAPMQPPQTVPPTPWGTPAAFAAEWRWRFSFREGPIRPGAQPFPEVAGVFEHVVVVAYLEWSDQSIVGYIGHDARTSRVLWRWSVDPRYRQQRCRLTFPLDPTSPVFVVTFCVESELGTALTYFIDVTSGRTRRGIGGTRFPHTVAFVPGARSVCLGATDYLQCFHLDHGQYDWEVITHGPDPALIGLAEDPAGTHPSVSERCLVVAGLSWATRYDIVRRVKVWHHEAEGSAAPSTPLLTNLPRAQRRPLGETLHAPERRVSDVVRLVMFGGSLGGGSVVCVIVEVATGAVQQGVATSGPAVAVTITSIPVSPSSFVLQTATGPDSPSTTGIVVMTLTPTPNANCSDAPDPSFPPEEAPCQFTSSRPLPGTYHGSGYATLSQLAHDVVALSSVVNTSTGGIALWTAVVNTTTAGVVWFAAHPIRLKDADFGADLFAAWPAGTPTSRLCRTAGDTSLAWRCTCSPSQVSAADRWRCFGLVLGVADFTVLLRAVDGAMVHTELHTQRTYPTLIGANAQCILSKIGCMSYDSPTAVALSRTGVSVRALGPSLRAAGGEVLEERFSVFDGVNVYTVAVDARPPNALWPSPSANLPDHAVPAHNPLPMTYRTLTDANGCGMDRGAAFYFGGPTNAALAAFWVRGRLWVLRSDGGDALFAATVPMSRGGGDGPGVPPSVLALDQAVTLPLNASTAAFDGAAFFPGQPSDVVALYTTTGARGVSYSMITAAWPHRASQPLQLYFPSAVARNQFPDRRCGVVAIAADFAAVFECGTLEMWWSVALPLRADSPLAIAGDVFVVVDVTGRVAGVSAVTAQLLFELVLPEPLVSAGVGTQFAARPFGDSVIVTVGGGVARINATLPSAFVPDNQWRVVWYFSVFAAIKGFLVSPAPGPVTGDPVVESNHVVLPCTEALVGLDAVEGSPVWVTVADQVSAPIRSLNGLIISGSQTGWVSVSLMDGTLASFSLSNPLGLVAMGAAFGADARPAPLKQPVEENVPPTSLTVAYLVGRYMRAATLPELVPNAPMVVDAPAPTGVPRPELPSLLNGTLGSMAPTLAPGDVLPSLGCVGRVKLAQVSFVSCANAAVSVGWAGAGRRDDQMIYLRHCGPAARVLQRCSLDYTRAMSAGCPAGVAHLRNLLLRLLATGLFGQCFNHTATNPTLGVTNPLCPLEYNPEPDVVALCEAIVDVPSAVPGVTYFAPGQRLIPGFTFPAPAPFAQPRRPPPRVTPAPSPAPTATPSSPAPGDSSSNAGPGPSGGSDFPMWAAIIAASGVVVGVAVSLSIAYLGRVVKRRRASSVATSDSEGPLARDSHGHMGISQDDESLATDRPVHLNAAGAYVLLADDGPSSDSE